MYINHYTTHTHTHTHTQTHTPVLEPAGHLSLHYTCSDSAKTQQEPAENHSIDKFDDLRIQNPDMAFASSPGEFHCPYLHKRPRVNMLHALLIRRANSQPVISAESDPTHFTCYTPFINWTLTYGWPQWGVESRRCGEAIMGRPLCWWTLWRSWDGSSEREVVIEVWV